MENRTNTTQSWRFGVFEVDARNSELRRGGTPIKVREQSFCILVFLLEHAGELVTREDLQRALWSSDTFVDFEHGLNTAVMKLREALGDPADKPLYIETVPKRGYRFIAPVSSEKERTLQPESITASSPAANVVADANGMPARNSASTVVHPLPRAHTRRRLAIMIACFAVVLSAGAGWLAHKRWHAVSPALPAQRALTRLTFDEGLQIGATWSPDGRYIAYSSDRGGKSDIWVQQISGGDPIQVTKDPGQNWQPDWSPDGRYIAYRSEESDGGIYITPALGGVGQQRKIAPFGYYPLWSPDSSQILLQTRFESGSNRFYIAQLDGSAPREVQAEFLKRDKLAALSAAWHPDGKRITIWVGDSSPSPSFWMVPIGGGPEVKLEIAPAVQKELAEFSGKGEIGDQQGDAYFSWSPSGDALYFERGFRGATNIFKLTVDPERMQGIHIERLTTGPGSDRGVAVSRDGKRLAFTASSQQQIETWLFPFDAVTGQIKGSGNAISSPGRTSVDPVLSPDGTKVTYNSPRGESDDHLNVRNELWLKSLVDGRETPIIADDYSRWYPHWSPDGMRLVYERRNPKTNEHQIMVWSSQSHEEEPLTGVLTGVNDSLGGISDWCPDGKGLLTVARDGIWLVPVSSAPRAETAAKRIVSDPAYRLYQAHMSPDGRWIVFIVFNAETTPPNPESSLFVVPASGGPWTRITDGKHWDDKPRWSPDGKIIYYVTRPGGFFNVWGIHFDPAAGKPVGQPFQVSKFDSPRLMIPRWIGPVGISLTQDKLVLTVAQASGNIWVLDNVDR